MCVRIYIAFAGGWMMFYTESFERTKAFVGDLYEPFDNLIY